MNYIITTHNDVVLGAGMQHHDLALGATGDVVSAGQVRIKNGKVEVYGESSGYGIKAKPEDAYMIAGCLGIPLSRSQE